jgi:uncharacterized coiled-coil DUF342 family protein
MQQTKKNSEHLLDLINKMDVPQEQKDEAIEFVESMQEEINDAVKEADDLQDEVDKLQENYDELQSDLLNSPEEELATIDMGYGNIFWKSDNLKLEMYMESLSEKLKSEGI